MDKSEAIVILQSELEKYRQRSYTSLVTLIKNLDAYEVRGPSGTQYQLEVQVLWDDKSGGNLRVMASIDDGGFISAFAPVTDSFILSTDGVFLDE